MNSVDKMLELLGQTNRSMTFVFDQDTRKFIHLEGAVKELLGFTRQQIVAEGESWQKAIIDGEESLVTAVEKDWKTEGQTTLGFRVRLPDRTVKHLHGTALARTLNGKRYVTGSIAETVKRSPHLDETSLRLMSEHTQEGIALTDENGCFLFLNSRLLQLFGYESQEQLLGRPWSVLYAEEVAQKIKKTSLPLVAKEGLWRGTVVAKRRDGTPFRQALALSSRPGGGLIYSCDGVAPGLEPAEEKFLNQFPLKEFLNTLPFGVMIREHGGREGFINDAVTAFIQREAPEFSKMPLTLGCLIDDPRWKTWAELEQKVIQTGQALAIDSNVHWGGRDWVLNVLKLPIGFKLGRVTQVATIITDVTERSRLERTEAETSQQLREYLVMQREFVAMVSHELRTPLTAIHGVYYLLNQQNEGKPTVNQENFRRLLKMQSRAIEALKELVDRVTELNRLDQMDSTDVVEPSNLETTVEFIVNTMSDILGHKRLELKSNLPACYGVRVSAPQLRALVENSLSNALKYSPENLPVKIILAGDASAWTITVIDQGRGIPKADLPNLFKPFARASNVGNVPGIGLGLVIISSILKRHGGSISIDSTVGRGTSVAMEIPHQLVENTTLRSNGALTKG